MKRKYLILIFIILFLLFLVLYKTSIINNLDNLVYDVIIRNKSDLNTRIMKFFTFFGSTYFILFLMFIFLISTFIKGKIFMIINFIIICNTIINRIVKVIVRRERPTLINLINETSFSFPSGHTMISVSLYGFIIYLIYKSKINKKIRIILIISLLLLISLIIISRIYLGVHYFSDCCSGIFLSLAFLLFIIEILERKNII